MDILVVDDSAFMRKIVTDLLEKMPNIHVSNAARNGKHALKLLQDKQPDLVLLDVEMPILNGLETLKEIKRLYDLPVIMLSALSNKDITIEALALGAADFVEKPTNIRDIQDEWIREFYGKIKSIHAQNRRVPRRVERIEKVDTTTPTITERSLPSRIQAIVIGASTGGPKALLKISQSLPANLNVPIFIVQHMPKGFTTSFAKRMDDESAVSVKEAQDGMSIEKCVYLCPGDYHMTITQGKISLNQEAKIHGTRPAVDYLFKSAAQVYRRELIGVILTGMGKDGAEGMREIQRFGGYTIAQDKESSVVFGMPRQAIMSGVVNEVLSLEEIGPKLRQMVR